MKIKKNKRLGKNEDKGILYLGWFIAFMIVFLVSGKALANEDERYCMAQNIYFESANQSFAGKLAVGHVVINRVRDAQFPNDVCGVIYQAKTKVNWKGNEVPIRNQCQFSWYCDGKSDEPVDSATWLKSLYISDLILEIGYSDITEGSLYYHADYILPYWADELEHVVTIDNHLFYK